MTKPDVEKFNKYHKEPCEYGEDGEIVVVSGEYTYGEALRLVKQFMRDNWFDSDQELEDVDVQRRKISDAEDQDDEYQYYYNGKDDKGPYDAWVWTA